jgi:hypothetical protein
MRTFSLTYVFSRSTASSFMFADTVKFEIGFSSQLSMIFIFDPTFYAALTIYG